MPSTTTTAASVESALAARCHAVVAGDVDYLNVILAPQFRHVHAGGKVEPREVYLAAIASGKTKFTQIVPSELTIDSYGPCTLVFGNIYIGREVDGEAVGRTSRFVSVWENSGTSWKLAHWQMTPMKESAS